MSAPAPRQFRLEVDGVELAGETCGEGPAVLLLHGLSATRRYVTLGSRLLAKRGFRMVAYDARGHGESSPAPSYGYAELAADAAAVLDALGIERAALAGHSMGAHTAARLALEQPERVGAIVPVGPAYAGHPHTNLDGWDAVAAGLERDGVEGFIAAYDSAVGERWRDTVIDVVRQRLSRHRHPGAVAQALREVPRSAAFGGLAALRALDVPALVVGSRDEADPVHRLAVAEAWAEHLPRAELLVEDEGESPLSWRGAQLSRAIADFLERAGISPAKA